MPEFSSENSPIRPAFWAPFYFTGQTGDELLQYACCLLIISGADRQVSDQEMQWLETYLMAAGADEAMFEQLRAFDYKHSPLASFLKKLKLDITSWEVERSLLYHAIRMSRADARYAIEEKKAVMKAASLLGVSRDIAMSIHRIVELEETVESLKVTLFNAEV